MTKRRARGSAPTEPSKNAVIYVRVSTKEQVQSLSLTSQEDLGRERCAREGLNVVRVFREEGQSGTSSDRDALNALLEYCENPRNRIGVAVITVVDRFMRNMGQHFVVKARLAEAGVRVLWTEHNFGTDDDAAEMMEAVYAWQAQQFSRNLSKRTIVGMQTAVKHGRYSFAPPLGYLRGTKDGASLVIDEARAPLVRQLFEDVAWSQCTVPQALARVTAAGLRSKKGLKVAVQTAHRILTNPTYAGRVSSPKWGLEAEGNFAAIITRELFEDTQAALARASRSHPSSHRAVHPEFPLRVFARCSSCGDGMTGSYSKGRGGRYAYYFCRKGCAGMRIRQEKLDALFVALLADVQPRPAYMRLFREIVIRVHRERHADVTREREHTQRRIDALVQRRMKATDALLDSVLTPDDYRASVERIDREHAEAKSALRGLARDEHVVESALVFAERSLADLAGVWNRLEPEARARFQRAVFPEGVAFDGHRFGTPKTASVFTYLRLAGEGSVVQASPEGFEPS